MEQAEHLIQQKKNFEPDSFPATQEQLSEAQVDSQHYNMT